MKIHDKDINNWLGVESQLLRVDDEIHMRYLVNTMKGRPLNISPFIMPNSDETKLIVWDRADKVLSFYQEIEINLYKKISDFEIVKKPNLNNLYVYVRETDILPGVSVDDEGNLFNSGLIGLKINFVEPIEDNFQYRPDDWIGADDESIFSNFYISNRVNKRCAECDEYISF